MLDVAAALDPPLTTALQWSPSLCTFCKVLVLLDFLLLALHQIFL